MRHGQQRRELGIAIGKGLQPGDVGGEAQIAVAEHDGRVRIDFLQHDIVPAYQRLAIDPLGRLGEGGRGRDAEGERGPQRPGSRRGY
ncbi:MAG: hypothetical protein J7500_12795 [Sphingomonas sp.]|uniref:hypothetical protein n=1 Tax=Sphingomonas sp. TaxID=28214 RepID=UPI001B2F853D|nr:hypothetical protein [Sphingomonas sp.]MBO9623579.1 hypothetical protein [Sphingomonas sp.]